LNLETSRLMIRPHTMENLAQMNRWDNDPELLLYNDCQPENRQPDSLEDTRAYRQRIIRQDPPRGMRHFAIHKKDGSFIGFGMLAFIDPYNRSCKLGITIGEKSEWGKGYAREALEAVIAYCFEQLNMNRVGSEIYAFNERSIRLFESLGFQREGVVRQAVWKRQAFVDEYIYGLLREEWLRGRGAR
jgi:RimJ/RimL family protein N-acetyltransferase